MQLTPTFVNCHICTASVRTDIKKFNFAKCPVCNADFINRGNETLVRMFACKYKSMRQVKGVLYVSDKRMIFVGDNDFANPATMAVGGTAGAFAAFKQAQASTAIPPPADLVIDLADVTGFNVSEIRLAVQSSKGTVYEFYSSKFQDYADMFTIVS